MVRVRGGSGTATFAVATFRIEEVNEPQVPLSPALIGGDINRDRCVNIEDLADLVLRWLDACVEPRWCEGADIDESNEVDFGDFSYIAGNWQQCLRMLHNLGYVVVSPGGPLDGGDFGPATFGTETSGLQEAFDFGSANGRDVFIIGGLMVHGVAAPVIYFVDTTLIVPPAQNWRITGGDYVINFTMTNEDCLVFDSQKNCQFKFGLIVGPDIEDSSTLMKIIPQTPRPDDSVGVSSSSFLINALVGGGDVFGGGVVGAGTALCLDAALGPIENNEMLIMEINACRRGIFLKQGNIRNNLIECPFNHITNNMLVVHTGSFNRIKALLQPTGVGGTVTGAKLTGGQENIYTLAWSNFGAETPLVFGPDARDNVIYAMGLPYDSVVNNATVPTNRIVPNKPVGLNLTTPPFPASGTDLQNRSSYTVAAIITSVGMVRSWTLTDGNGLTQTVDYGLYPGQLIYMEPGETVNLTYTKAPSWRWQALR